MSASGLFPSLTYEVPAASGGGAPDPVALELVHLPLPFHVIRQGVGGQVTDLNLIEVGLKVIKLHPTERTWVG